MTEPTIDEALGDPTETFLAWNLEPWEGQAILGVYRVSEGAPERLAWAEYPESEQKAVGDAFLARGFGVGGCDADTDRIWVAGPGTLTAWYGDEGRILRATGDDLEFGAGRHIRRDTIARVVSYAAEDYVDRGVRVELHDGTSTDVVFDMNLTAQSMIGYSRNDLLFDSSWAVYLGAELAAWAGVPFENRI